MKDVHYLFGRMTSHREFYRSASSRYSFSLREYVQEVLEQAKDITHNDKFVTQVDDCSIYKSNHYGNNIASMEIGRKNQIFVIESDGSKTPIYMLDTDDMEQVARYATSIFNNVCVRDHRDLVQEYED